MIRFLCTPLLVLSIALAQGCSNESAKKTDAPPPPPTGPTKNDQKSPSLPKPPGK